MIIAFKTKQEKNPKVNNLKKKKKDTSVLKFNMSITFFVLRSLLPLSPVQTHQFQAERAARSFFSE